MVVAVPADNVLDVAGDALRAGTKGLLVVTSGFAESGPGGGAPEGPCRVARPLARRAADRPQLPGPVEHPPGRQPQREPRAADGAARPHRLLLRTPRRSGLVILDCRGGARPGLLHLRVRRQPRRRLGQRPAAVLGRGSVHRRRAALPGDVRQRAALYRSRAALLPEADPVREERPQQGRPRRRARAHCRRGGPRRYQVDVLFHQAGVIRADTLEEMFDVAALLAHQPLPTRQPSGGRSAIPAAC